MHTVKLLKDTEECIAITANQCINLDLNGHKIINDNNVITNEGTLYVNGGSIISGGNAIYTNGKGLFIGNESPCNLQGTGEGSVVFSNIGGVKFYSGTIINSMEENAGPCVKLYENGAKNELYMYGGEIICNNGHGVYIKSARAYLYAGKITATTKNGNACYADGYLTIGEQGKSGPTITGDGYTLIKPISYTTTINSGNFELKTSGNIIKASGGYIYINGGNFINDSGSDLIGVSGARTYINGGNFRSNVGYCASIKSGYLYINNGSFYGTKEYVLSRTGGTYSIKGGTYNDVTITDELVKK